MASKSKLSPDEAQEYSSSLGKAATGNYELMDFAIHTLRVPEALGMTPGEWVESIGGYVRQSIESRRVIVADLDAQGKTPTEIARVLGVSVTTVGDDKNVIAAARRLALEAPIEAEDSPTSGSSTKEDRDAEINRRIEAGESDAAIAAATGVSTKTVNRARKAIEKEIEEAAASAPTHPTRSAGSGSTTTRKPSKSQRESDALTTLDGYLARIEGHALGFAAWWRQEGQKDLSSKLAWVDETVSHTEEKVQMILRSVRGVNSDADAALTEWLAEEEGRSS